MNVTFSCRFFVQRTAIVCTLLCFCSAAIAANKTWDGGGADSNWLTGANWDLDAAPLAGDALIFDGLTGLSTNNDFAANTLFSGMTFNATAGAFTLGGAAINLGGNITDNQASLAEIVNLNMALTATRTATVATGGSLTLGGVISGATFGLTKAGAGTLTLGAANTYTGPTSIGAGTLALRNGDNRLATTSTVAFTGSGTFDVGSTNQTIGSLTFADGSPMAAVITGTGGTLTVNGAADLEIGPSAPTATVVTTANMSGLSNFVYSAPANTFRVGLKTGGNAPAGITSQIVTATLGANNTITAAALAVGDLTGARNPGNSTLHLGQSNVFNVANVNIGYSGRSGATLDFATGLTSPTVKIRALNGTGAVSTFNIGQVANNATTTWTAAVDLSAGSIDALVTSMIVGSADTGTQTTRQGTINASFAMGAGTATVGTLTIGRINSGTGGTVTATFAANGTFTINNAAGILNATTITLADNLIGTNTGTTRTVNGTLALTNGTIKANTIQRGATTGTATATLAFNWAAGTVQNTDGADLLISSVPINLSTAASHVFNITGSNTATVNATSIISGATSGITKNGTGTLVLAAANTYAGPTTIAGGTLTLAAGSSISNTSAITVANSATLNAAAIVGGLSLGGSQTLTNNGTVAGNVTAGGSSQIVSGTGTFSNGVTINNGTLLAGNSTTTGTLNITGALAVNGGAASFKIGGASSDLIQVGGSATFASNNQVAFNFLSPPTSSTYTVLTAAGGISGLTGGTPQTVGRVNFTISSADLLANKLTLTNVSGGAAALFWSGANGSTWDIQSPSTTGTQNWINAVGNAADFYFDGDGVTFDTAHNSSGNFNINISSNVAPAAVNVTSGTYSLAGSSITGLTGVSVSGSGTLTMNAGLTNTYTGVTTISGSGTLVATDLQNLNTASSIGAGLTTSGSLVLDGGKLQWAGSAAQSTNRGFTLTQNGGTIDASPTSGGLTITGAIAFSGSGARTLTLSGTDPGVPANNTFSPAISDAAVGQATSVVKSGNNTWVLGGANPFTGGLTVNGGTIRVATIASGGTGPITINSGATIALTNGTFANTVSLNGGTLGNLGSTDVLLSGDVTATGNSTVYTVDPQALAGTSRNVIISGILHGSGNITVINSSVVGTTATTDGNQGFRLRGTAVSDFTGKITVSAAAKFELQTTQAGPFSPGGSGTIVLTAGTTNTNALTGTYSEFNLRNNSAGATTFGNNVEITGTGTVIANLLSDTANGAQIAPTGSASILGNLKIGSGQEIATYKSSTNGTGLTLQFQSATLTGDGATFTPKKAGFAASDTVNPDAGDIVVGSIAEQTPGAGYGINVSGVRTLFLTGASTYTGNTNVNSGTLELTGTLAATGNLFLNSSSASPRLTGTGNLGVLNVGSNGSGIATVSPGTSAVPIATLTTHGLQVNGGNLQVDLAATNSSDQIAVLGSASYNAASTITITDQPLTGVPNGTYTLLTSTGLSVGTEPTLVKPTRQNYSLTHPGNNLILTVSGTAISGNIVWTGSQNSNWDVGTTQNWLNGGSPDFFFRNDNVTFNDSSIVNPALITTVIPGSITVDTSSTAYNFIGAGSIAGSGGLTKKGTSTLTISNTGVNSYTGTTAVQNGTLKVGAAGAIPAASAVVLGDSGTSGALDSNGLSFTIGGLSTSGTGAANLVTNSGTAASTLTVAGGGTFGGIIQNGAVAAATTALTVSSGTLTLTGANTYTGATTVNASATLRLGGGGASGSIVTAVTDNGTLAFNRNDAVTFAGVISGSGGVQQIGGGTVSLTGTNTYSGITAITNGILIAGSANTPLGSTAGATNISGNGAFDINGQTLNTTEQFNVSGTGFNGLGVVVNNGAGSAANNISRFSLTGDATIGGTGRWDFRNNNPVLDLGGFTLTKAGANQISVVGGTINPGGHIIINSGIFSIETTSSVLAGSSGDITFNDATTFQLFGNNANELNMTRPLNINGTVRIFNNSGLSVTVASPVTINGTMNFNSTNAAAAITFSGNIGETAPGAGILSKVGPNTVTLSGTNSYSGGTTISAGTIQTGSNGALGASAASLAVNGGATAAAAGTLNVGSFSVGVGALNGSAGVAPGTVTGALGGQLSVGNGNASGSYSGTFSGGVSLNKNGTGTQTLAGTNSSTGSITINDGVLNLGSATAINANNLVNFGSTGSPILRLSGNSASIGGLTGFAGAVENTNATPATITVSGLPTDNFFGTLRDGVGGGALGLTKTSSLNLTLGSVNTYTGNTTVNGGILQLGTSGAVSSASNLVLGGGTLGTAATNQTLNQLNVSAAGSHIDLGAAGSSTVHLSASGGVIWNTTISTALLTIDNWNPNTHLFVGSVPYSLGSTSMGLATTQLQRIQFSGHPLGATLTTGGELVPQDVGGAILPFPKGDFNLNHSLDAGDISAMLSALTDLPGFKTTNHLFDSDLAFLGDFDGSGTLSNRDIQGLLDSLAGPGAGGVSPVPEPTTLLLAAVGLIGLIGIHAQRRIGGLQKSSSQS